MCEIQNTLNRINRTLDIAGKWIHTLEDMEIEIIQN